MTDKNNKENQEKTKLLIRKGLPMLKDMQEKTEWHQKTLQKQTRDTLARNPCWPTRNNKEKL